MPCSLTLVCFICIMFGHTYFILFYSAASQDLTSELSARLRSMGRHRLVAVQKLTVLTMCIYYWPRSRYSCSLHSFMDVKLENAYGRLDMIKLLSGAFLLLWAVRLLPGQRIVSKFVWPAGPCRSISRLHYYPVQGRTIHCTFSCVGDGGSGRIGYHCDFM